MNKDLILASVLPIILCACALAGCNQREIKETTTEASTRIYTLAARENSDLPETAGATAESPVENTYDPSAARRTTQKSDAYDVNDYAHPDDFYYDHYDDFWDYEDAEDYYYEHDD